MSSSARAVAVRLLCTARSRRRRNSRHCPGAVDSRPIGGLYGFVRIPLTSGAGRAVVVIPVIVVAAASLAACGGGGSTNGPTGQLGTALAKVRDSPTTRTEVQFGQPAAALKANDGKLAGGPYGTAIGYGLGTLAPVLALSQHALGFDPARAQYAITAGQPPNAATLVSGLHLGATAARLRALGAAQSGTTFRFAPDNKVLVNNRLSAALPGLVSGFNVVQLNRADLRFAANSDSLDATNATSSGLSSYHPMAAVASCLGNPLAADIVNKLPNIRKLVPRSTSRATDGLQMVGVGLSGKSGTKPTEQLCVNVDSTQHANQVAAAMRTAVHSGTSFATNQRWSALLTAPSVQVHDTTVSLTAHPAGDTGGILLRALVQGDLPGVYG
jgi:hypothetical protein